ncbi:DddA-like double-stranded DNA deaminase toxin [Saccharothrix lopnurensis]|uniref:DddA-like double-stranded DNA deaminase toxin n=1 Tax=Saccharothrix lopnurensis TaxID=1670621 RepID=A0ABW1PEV2_9PSEU
MFSGVADACKGHYWPLLNEAVKDAYSYADHLTAKGTTDPAPAIQRPAQPPIQHPPIRQIAPDDPAVVPRERVEAIRRTLPPPVVPRTGQKTVGQWIGPDGDVESITSGFDQRSALVQGQLARMGLSEGSARSGDVEQKLAAHMAAHGIRHATVIINNVPCRQGPDSCDALVPILLPEGYSLTVHGQNTNGTRTRIRYTGGAQPWWR